MSEIEESRPGRSTCDADRSMSGLAELFSTPEIKAKVHHRCGIGGPTEMDVLFETAIDDVFGRDQNSAYKCWIRRLYSLGLISYMPDDWKGQSLLDQVGFEARKR